MSIADDIVCRFKCSWCGICFEEEHGYPVACKDCWEAAVKEYGEKNLSGVQKAIFKEGR